MLSRELENSCLDFTFQFLNLDNARLQTPEHNTIPRAPKDLAQTLSKRNAILRKTKPQLRPKKQMIWQMLFFRDLEQSPIHETVNPWPRSCLSHAHLISSSMKISCAKPRLRVRLSLLPSLPGTLVPRCTKSRKALEPPTSSKPREFTPKRPKVNHFWLTIPSCFCRL